jgi:predicted nucleotidyltransferase
MTPDDRDVAWIVESIRSRYATRAIYLFGSHAKQTPHTGSDIDLLIVGDTRLPRFSRGREVAAALKAFPAGFDLLFYTEAELAAEMVDPLSFMSRVMTTARRLYPHPDPAT